MVIRNQVKLIIKLEPRKNVNHQLAAQTRFPQTISKQKQQCQRNTEP